MPETDLWVPLGIGFGSGFWATVISWLAAARKLTPAAIKKLGGKFEVDENNDVVSLELHGSKVTDAGLARLKGLTNLKELWLGSTGPRPAMPDWCI